MHIEITILLAQFCLTTLAGLQHLNIKGTHFGAAAMTSVAMSSFSFMLLPLIANQTDGIGSLAWVAFATGSATGITFSMWLHPRVITRLRLLRAARRQRKLAMRAALNGATAAPTLTEPQAAE